MKSIVCVCCIIFLNCILCMEAAAIPINATDHKNAFWYGNQSLECLNAKQAMVKRSVDFKGIERPVTEYFHRLVYYNGTYFEWGNREQGYHFGQSPASPECPITWEDEPAGTSSCSKEVIEEFSREYRAKYGRYNLILNNCHHFANRVAIILTQEDCKIGHDKWSSFADDFWNLTGWLYGFMF